jgi:transcription elongation GreA/GreB family factor
MAVPSRENILSQCRQALEARKREYSDELRSLDEAAAGETKSSAGDKYETGREMIAQSRRLIERNLSETEAGLDALDRMAAAPEGGTAGGKIGFGTLAETSLGWYLVGASLGELESQGVPVRTVSLASPLGMALRGKSPGEDVPWRGSVFRILAIAPDPALGSKPPHQSD